MPIRKRWTRFTEENVRKLSNDQGAHKLANKDKKIIDLGGSDSFTSDIRGRLMSHLRANKYYTAKYFRCESTFCAMVLNWKLPIVRNFKAWLKA